MVEVTDIQAQMAGMIAGLAQGNGLTPSTVPKVKILYSTVHQPRTPVMYTRVWLLFFRAIKWAIWVVRCFSTIRRTT